jgi:diguanylate cyclase (GGDEF)-like protein/PAS domain S-box-containing protein
MVAMPICRPGSEPGMHSATIDLSYSTLLVFVFGTVVWVRQPDGRASFWFGGWLAVFGSYFAHFCEIYAAGWQRIAATAISADLVAIAGICFAVAAAIPVAGQRLGILVGAAVAIPTLLCLTISTLPVQHPRLLVAVVLMRQLMSIALSWALRRFRRGFALTVATLSAADTILLMALIVRGSCGWLIAVILAEVFFVAGLDVWNKHIGNTIGMRVTAVGFLAWGLGFPLAEIAHRILPQLTTDSDLWNPPKAVVAMGMMLIVFEEELSRARALGKDYRLLFDNNPNPVWIYDVETLQLVAVNDAACAVHGYTKEEFLCLRLPDILHPEIQESVILGARQLKAGPTRASRHLRKDGTEFPMDITAHNVDFKGKRCRFILGIDVTRREYLERQLEFELEHDALTGLANRRLFEKQLTYAVAEAVESKKKVAVLCLDIRRFKRLNEVFGQQIGDECVRYVARVLTGLARADDWVARTGDDEFAVMLTALSDFSFAEEITSHLTEGFKTPATIGGYEIQLSLDVGLAGCPDDSENAMTVWHLAENALRRSQLKGTGQAIWLSAELRKDAEMRAEIAASLTRLLEEDRFYLAYQPLYRSNGMVGGMEALLRLDHPQYGAIAPPIVIQTAEETGLIEQLGEWVLDRGCRQMRTWMDQGVRMVPVAINVSPMQLVQGGFAERLSETMDRYSVDPQQIHLEITETAAMNNLRAVSREMSILSALGSRFSIDDFGTGHSSLGRLHQLPISVLKIDRSFIKNLTDCDAGVSDTPGTIVQAIVSMSHAMGLQVVAEGVETEGQLRCLKKLRCDLYQGFLLSRPVGAEEVPQLLARTNPLFSTEPVGNGGLSRSEELVPGGRP